jgi:hypothetical protein
MRELSWAKVNEGLLSVRSALHKNYNAYAEMLPPKLRPHLDWLTLDLLPTLVLLPGSPDSEKLALALELSYLAGCVHDEAVSAGKELPGRAILVGDYLYAASAVKLAHVGYDGWLGRVGRVLARRSEGMIVRQYWAERPYVTEFEKIANLHKENAEGFSLAATMAAEKTDWSMAEKKAYAEFGFYLGMLQGICRNAYRRDSGAYAEALQNCRTALANVPQVEVLAGEHILSKFENQVGAEYDKKNGFGQAIKKASAAAAK